MKAFFCHCELLNHKQKDAQNEMKNDLHFILKEKIVETTNSKVYKCLTYKKLQKIAFKKIRLESCWGLSIENINEISAMQELKHPNIVSLKLACLSEEILNLIYEFFPIDLKKYMDNLPHGQLLETQLVKNYLNQITQGIYLFSNSLC